VGNLAVLLGANSLSQTIEVSLRTMSLFQENIPNPLIRDGISSTPGIFDGIEFTPTHYSSDEGGCLPRAIAEYFGDKKISEGIPKYVAPCDLVKLGERLGFVFFGPGSSPIIPKQTPAIIIIPGSKEGTSHAVHVTDFWQFSHLPIQGVFFIPVDHS